MALFLLILIYIVIFVIDVVGHYFDSNDCGVGHYRKKIDFAKKPTVGW